MKIFNKKNKNISEGFTLIEALVSIALLLIAVIGPLSLTFNALNAIRENKNRVVASYLAEEIIEDFRNYRDNFALSCSSLNINYDYTNQQISSMYCASDTTDSVPINYYNFSTPPDTNPQDIAWKMFLFATMGNANPPSNTSITDLYLDNNAFYFSPQYLFNNNVASDSNCNYLKESDMEGFNCSQGDITPFERTVTLTKLSGNTLKIDVSVVYFESEMFLIQRQRSLTVTDYIYER